MLTLFCSAVPGILQAAGSLPEEIFAPAGASGRSGQSGLRR